MALIGISIVIAALSFILYSTSLRNWFSSSSNIGLKEEEQPSQQPDIEEKPQKKNDGALADESSTAEKEIASKIDVPRLTLPTDMGEASETEEEDPTTPTATTTPRPFILPPSTEKTMRNAAEREDITPIGVTTHPTSTIIKAQENTKGNDSSSIKVPNLPNTIFSSPSSAMLPPPRPRPKAPLVPIPQQAAPLAGASLRVPNNGPLPNRNTASKPSSSSLMPPPSFASSTRSLPRTLPGGSTLNPSSATASTLPTQKRKKVILSPGHSPIDWAHLIKTSPSTTLTGLPAGRQLRISPSQLALHNGRKGAPAWSAWQGKVYNIATYLPYHPGGEEELLRAAGKQGSVVEKMFMEVHPWVNWENMLGSCVVGVLVAEGEGDELVVEEGKGKHGEVVGVRSELEDMD